MMRIVPCEFWHMRAVGADWATDVIPGESFCGLIGIRPMVCGGITMVLPCVYEAWVCIAPDAPRYPVASALKREFPRMLDWAFGKGIRRIQCACQTDWRDANRLIQSLGFECEGVMRQYGVDGKDHFRWAIAREL